MIIARYALQVLIGLAFIASGLLKLYPIEPFEYKFVEIGLFNFMFAPIAARLIIGIEVLLGIFLITNLYKPIIKKLTLGLLGFFTFFVIYIWITEGSDADCGCMGTYFQLTPLQSIIKNILLITAILFIPSKSWILKYKAIPISLALLALSSGFLLHLPDFDSITNKYSNKVNFTFNDELLGFFEDKGEFVNFKEGDKLIAFLSVSCQHCEHLAQKIAILQKEMELPPVYYVFIGKEEKVPDFFKKTKRSQSYKMFNDDKFFELVGSSIPVLYYLKDGEVIYKWNKITLNESEIRQAVLDYQQ